VSTLAKAFKKIKFYTRENVGIGEINLPPEEFETEACALVLKPELVASARPQEGRRSELPAGCRRTAAGPGAAVRARRSGRREGARRSAAGALPAPTVILYDRIPNGVGLAERIYRVHREILDAALALVQRAVPQRLSVVHRPVRRASARAARASRRDPAGPAGRPATVGRAGVERCTKRRPRGSARPRQAAARVPRADRPRPLTPEPGARSTASAARQRRRAPADAAELLAFLQRRAFLLRRAAFAEPPRAVVALPRPTRPPHGPLWRRELRYPRTSCTARALARRAAARRCERLAVLGKDERSRRWIRRAVPVPRHRDHRARGWGRHRRVRLRARLPPRRRVGARADCSCATSAKSRRCCTTWRRGSPSSRCR
jgi:hypothetical protein